MSTSDPQNQSPGRTSSGPPPHIPDHELLRRIGKGAYGEVWLARNIMGTWRAVKIVYRRNFEDDRPFEREFNGIQKFEPISRSHDSQVDILHVGRGEGYFYYVMELADDQQTGQQINPDTYRPKTLKSEASRRGALPVDECVALGLQLTTALSHLHGEGLVHRDIKPSNIIFIKGVPKLADIGLVTSADATVSFVGTQGFYPPEGPGTPQGDIYSLGKVLYEMFSGRDRQDFPELPTSLAEHPDRERLLDLNAIVAKACAPEPKNRYKSTETTRQDLLLIQSGESVRRVRCLDQRVAQLARIGCVLGVAAVVAGVAYVFQQQEARLAKTIAEQKTALATQSQKELIQYEIDTGNRLATREDYHAALLWYARALKRMTPSSTEEAAHRIRIQSILGRAPRLLNLISDAEEAPTAQFSPDGEWFAKISTRGIATLWRTKTGERVAVLSEHNSSNPMLSFSEDSRRLLVMSSRGVWVFETNGINPVFSFEKQRDGAVHSSISPDGKQVLIATRSGKARLWNVEGEKQGRELGNDLGTSFPSSISAYVRLSSFSRDGQFLFTVSSGGDLVVWNLATGKPQVGARADRVSQIAFSSDSKLIGWSSGAIIHVLRISNVKTIRLHGTLFELTPNGRSVVTISEDGPAHWWDIDTRNEISLGIVQFSPDERGIVTNDEDNVDRHGTSHWRAVPPQQTYSLDRVCLRQDGESMMVAGGSVVFVRPCKDRAKASSILHHAGAITATAFHPDGKRVLTADANGIARLWELTPVDGQTDNFDDASGAKQKASHIPSVQFSSDCLEKLAEVLSGHCFDQDGNYLPLPVDVLRAKFTALRAKHPEFFGKVAEAGDLAR